MPKQVQVMVTIDGRNYPGYVGEGGYIYHTENELVFQNGQYFQVNSIGALTPFNPTTAYLSPGIGKSFIEAPVLLNNTPAVPPSTNQWLQSNIGQRLASQPSATTSGTSSIRLPSDTFAPPPEPRPLDAKLHPWLEKQAPVQASMTGHAQPEAPQPTAMEKLMMSKGVLSLTALASGFGIYKGVQAMAASHKFDGSAMLGMLFGAQQYLSSASTLLKKTFSDMSDGTALGVAGLTLAAIMLAGKFIKSKADNGPGPNDAPPLPNATTGGAQTNSTTSTNKPQNTTPTTGPWYRQINSTNVLMITAASALLAIGLNLGMDGKPYDFIKKDSSELQNVRNSLDASVGGGKLPSIGTSVLGKVFVQSSQNNGMTPDKIVYVSQDSVGTADKPADYSVNMLTLDYDGHVVSPNMPDVSYIPFFYKNVNGAIVPTPQGNAAVARERALALAASSDKTSTKSSAGAVNLSGTNHK